MTTPSPMTVHLIDDDDGVREALTILLTEAGFTVRSHRSGTEFLAAFETAGRGCIVSDIRMPGIDGLELQQKLKAAKSSFPLIFITGHGDIQMAVQAMREGALNFIEKPFDDNLLIEAVQSALKSVNDRPGADEADAVKARLDTLTPREREVLDCLVLGKPNKITAHDLGMSIRTAEVHRARIMQKMEASSLSELVRMVLSVQGLAPTPH